MGLYCALLWIDICTAFCQILYLTSAAVIATAAVYVGSYLLFATAGPAFPKQYAHADGGVYRGEWRGLKKEGLGVYT